MRVRDIGERIKRSCRFTTAFLKWEALAFNEENILISKDINYT
jgi:hypothetical protein